MRVQVSPLAPQENNTMNISATNIHSHANSVLTDKTILESQFRLERLSIIFGHALAIPLGLFAAVLAALIGPLASLLMSRPTELVPWSYWVQNPFGEWLASLTQSPGLSAEVLLRDLPVVLIVIAFIKAGLTLSQWYLWERTGERVSLRIRRKIADNFLGLSPEVRGSLAAQNIEEQLSGAVGNDIRLMREYIVHFHGGLPREGLQTLFLLLLLGLLSPKLLALFVIAIAPVGIVLQRLGKRLRRQASKALQDFSELTESLQQRLLGLETIKHYKTEQLEINSMTKLNQNLLARFLKANRTKARTSPMIELFAAIALVFVLYFAASEVKNGNATQAGMFSFFASLALLSQSSAKLGRYINSNREASGALSRLANILNFLGNNQGPLFREIDKSISPKVRHIDCKNLSYSYATSSKSALNDFNFIFETGKIYCICGASGAGKSTLMKLLLGLIPPTQGFVKFHLPTDTSDHSPEYPLLYMPQRVALAPDTIEANVAYPNENVDDPQFEKAIQRVKLVEIVAKLSTQQKTKIGTGGTSLSGGQAQRMLLARLAYHKSPFILVDEGTSALDPETEKQVLEFLSSLAKENGSAVIMIAHRAAVTRIADEIIILKNGQLVAAGTAKEISRNAQFRDLVS